MEYSDKIRLNVANMMYKGTILIAGHIADETAPKGWSLQLSRNIRAQKPFQDSEGSIVGVIASSARSKGGYNYAVRQHDEKLRHVSNRPLRTSFGDGQTGKTARARYNKGYQLARRNNTGSKFATEYMTIGLEQKREMLVSLLERAVREA
jgi:hypothetical protein